MYMRESRVITLIPLVGVACQVYLQNMFFLLSIFRCDNNNNSASVVTLGLRSKEQSTVESRSLKSGSRVYVLSNEVRGFLVVSAIAGLSRSVVVLVMGSR